MRPLVARSTWRRWAHAILGAALLMPFFLLGVILAAMVGANGDPVEGLLVVLGLFVLVLPLAGGVAMVLPAVRALEAVAARELLDTPRHQLGDEARSWEARQRTATWFVLHLALGGVVGGLTLLVPVATPMMIAAPLVEAGGDAVPFGLSAGWGPVVGVALLAGYLYLVAGTGAVMAWLAPRLLGRTQADQLASLSLQAARLAGRNQLARELHDSVGHALSIITVQAGAARRVGSAPADGSGTAAGTGSGAGSAAFVGSALEAIEEAARSALEDLDHVLGVMRSDDGTGVPRATAGSAGSTGSAGPAGSTAGSDGRPTRPQPTLGDLGDLVRATQAAGVDVDAAVSPGIAAVPPAVSREAYRIVQEGLTNVLRHAGRVPVSLRVTVLPGRLELELTNPVPSPGSGSASGAGATAEPAGGPAGPEPAAPGAGGRRVGGRGLPGIRERVAVLRGDVTAARDGDRWRVHVSLPLRSVT